MPPTQLRPHLARGQIRQCKMDIWLENIYPKKNRHLMHSRNSLKFDIQVLIRLSKEVNGQPGYDLVICGTQKFSEKVYFNFHWESCQVDFSSTNCAQYSPRIRRKQVCSKSYSAMGRRWIHYRTEERFPTLNAVTRKKPKSGGEIWQFFR